MKRLLFFLLMIGPGWNAYGQQREELMERLTGEIRQAEKYDEQKLVRLDSLYRELHTAGGHDSLSLYAELCDAYSLFRNDSAYWYSRKMLREARRTGNASAVASATIKLSFVLLLSGMAKEAFDSLSILRSARLEPAQKADYYTLMARYYYDLSDYTQQDDHRTHYNHEAASYLDSALLIYPHSSFEYNYYSGLKALRLLDFANAATYLKSQISNPSLTPHELALTASTLSDIYIRNGMPDSAISLLTKAAIADIKSSTKETSAIFHLATQLFRQGDVKNAAICIQKAADDANFYGSRQRKAQLSFILPLIKEKELSEMEDEKRNLSRYAVMVTVSFALLIALTVIILRQVKKLQTQQKIISQKNQTLQNLVKEKEWLLKEVHHRVKNNLQMVVSLLESQSHYLEEDALEAVQNSQNRVYAMSLIHQKLYQTDALGTINMQVYLPELVNYLCESFNVKQQIRFLLQVGNIELDVSQAVPIGLILNEAITNSIKYAFPHQGNNKIVIAMNRRDDGEINLVIADNGMGMPEPIQNHQTNSLGLKLMQGLTEDIGGQLTIAAMQGTTISILFMAHLPLHASHD